MIEYIKDSNGWTKEVKVTRDILEKIYRIAFKKYDGFSLREEVRNLEEKLRENSEEYIIPIRLFDDVIEVIQKDLDYDLEAKHRGVYEENENDNSMEIATKKKSLELINKYEEIIEPEFGSDGFIIKKKTFSTLVDIEQTLKFLELGYENLDVKRDFYLAIELTVFKKEILEDLKYVLSETELEEFLNEYNKLVEESKVKELKELLEKYQERILKHWEEYVNSFNFDNFKQGEPFHFIGHSLKSSNFREDDEIKRNGGFVSKFVSSSLFTERLTETFNRGFGFIFPPTGIVGADPRDMYLRNYAESDENITITVIKRIASPERMIEGAIKDKEENRKAEEEDPTIRHKKAYNEVGFDRFNPIGIFCFTNGSKELSTNYQDALKVQKHFPNLKIREIDITLCKDITKEELIEQKRDLLINLMKCDNPKTICYDCEWMLDSYSYLWDKFMKLKEEGKYSIEAVLDIYRHNKELIELYDYEKLKDFNMEELETVDKIASHLGQYSNDSRLDEIYPGLTEFLKLYKEIEKTGNNYFNEKKLNGAKSFVEINNVLNRFINEIKLDESKEKLRNLERDTGYLDIDVNNCNKRVESLENEILKEKNKLEEYERTYLERSLKLKELKEAESISNKEFLFSLLNNNIDDLDKQIETHTKNKNLKEDKEKELLEEINKLDDKLLLLGKHKILNKFRITHANIEKQDLERMLKGISETKNYYVEQLNEVQTRKNELLKEFERETGISPKEFKNKLIEAEMKLMNDDLLELEFEIIDIKSDIDFLKSGISNLENELKEAKEKAKINDSMLIANHEEKNKTQQEIELLKELLGIDDKSVDDSNTKKMGYVKISILVICALVLSILILVFGLILIK